MNLFEMLGFGKKPEATPAPAATTPIAPEGSVAPIQPGSAEPQLNIPTMAEPTTTPDPMPVSPTPNTENALPATPAATETPPTV